MAGLQTDLFIYDSFPESAVTVGWRGIKSFLKEGVSTNWGLAPAIGGSVTLRNSIYQGLDELQVNYIRNQWDSHQVRGTAYVISSIPALRFALELKKSGRFKKLYAGPTLVNLPSEARGLIYDSAIDGLLVPSEWIKKLFLKESISKLPPIHVHAIGVDTGFWAPSQVHLSKSKVLVLIKDCDVEVEKAVFEQLRGQLSGRELVVIRANSKPAKGVRDLLRECAFAVFLSRSESQGIMMLEAWSCDVPTFHWNPRRREYWGLPEIECSSCPYLDLQCGGEFAGSADLEQKLRQFLGKLADYRPRDFVLRNFELKNTVGNLLHILNAKNGDDRRQPNKVLEC